MFGKNKIKGFTLIELLVVIAIIGILAAISLVSFTGAQRQARDANRKSDLRMYQTALAQYASKNKGKYPSYGVGAVSLPDTVCSKLELSNCPADKDGTYKYLSNGTTADGAPKATQYVIWSTIETTDKDLDDAWVVCYTGDVGTYGQTPGSYECPTLNVEEPQPSSTNTPSSTPTPGPGTPTPTPTSTISPGTPTPTPTCRKRNESCGGIWGDCCTGLGCVAGRCVQL